MLGFNALAEAPLSALAAGAPPDGGVVETTRRRRRGVAEIYYPPRREVEREQVAEVGEIAPPPMLPDVAPLVPGAGVPARRPVDLLDTRVLGRVVGLDAASFARARRNAEMEAEDEDDVLLLLS